MRGVLALSVSTIFSFYAASAAADILISQDRALAGGITSGDAPGFPITISESGSYRLMSNLMTQGTDVAIEIQADNVTIDLGGFLIGSVNGHTYSTAITDNQVTRRGIVIRNGAISAFDNGIDLWASHHVTISQVRIAELDYTAIQVGPGAMVIESKVFDSKGSGIVTGPDSRVIGNIVFGSRGAGIWTQSNSIIESNTSFRNGGDGIDCTDNCTINANTSFSNLAHGIVSTRGSTINNNVVTDNQFNGIHCNDPCSIRGNSAFRNLFGLYTVCPSVIVGNLLYNNVSDLVLSGLISDCRQSNNVPNP